RERFRQGLASPLSDFLSRDHGDVGGRIFQALIMKTGRIDLLVQKILERGFQQVFGGAPRLRRRLGLRGGARQKKQQKEIKRSHLPTYRRLLCDLYGN